MEVPVQLFGYDEGLKSLLSRDQRKRSPLPPVLSFTLCPDERQRACSKRTGKEGKPVRALDQSDPSPSSLDLDLSGQMYS